MSVIQHAKERRHHLGTVRLLEASLTRCEVVVHHPRRSPIVEIDDRSPRAAVLYPTPAARRLDEVEIADRPDHLIVIDGTWSTAARLYRDNDWLHSLPHFTLPPGPEGRYRIRSEPDPRFMSTVEAVVRALTILEPQTRGLVELDQAFVEMVDRQLEFRGHPRPKKKPRRTQLPLAERWDQIVLLHAEHSGGSNPELVALGLLRPSDSESIELVLRPECSRPSAKRLAHIGLPPESLERAASRSQAAKMIEEWLAGDALIVSWTESTARLVRRAIPGLPEVFSLKTEYAQRHSGPTGALAAVLAREGIEANDVPVSGRIGVELGRLSALVARLRSC